MKEREMDFFKQKSRVGIKKDKIIHSGSFSSKMADWLIALSIHLTVIILPLFFLDNIPSPFELGKRVPLVGLVGFGTLVWIGKMAWKNEIKFRKSFLLIPASTFLLFYGLSTVFSEYREQSMWGYFEGEQSAFVSILFLVAFFILVYNNIRDYRGVMKLIFSFLLSGLFLGVLGILQFFEVYLLPFELAKFRFFNPLGSVYVFSIYISSVFLVSLTLFLSQISKLLKIILLILSSLSFFVLVVIGFKMVWIALLLALAFILGMNVLIENKNTSQARIIPMVFLVLTLFLMLKSKPLSNSNLPVETSIRYGTAIEISLSSLKSNALLGTGPTTFSDVYKKNKPSNSGDFSTQNFDESASFFLTLASTTGILGAISFLFLVFSGVFCLLGELIKIIKTENKNNLQSYLGVSIGVAWIFLTIFLFIYSANISILMLWWLFLALIISMSFLRQDNKIEINEDIEVTAINPKTSFAVSFGFVLVIIGFLAIIYLQCQKYIAAIYFNQALRASEQERNIEKTAEKITKALTLDSGRDSFYRDLAVVHIALAKEKIKEKGLENLSPEESNYVSARFKKALDSLIYAKDLNPGNSLNFVSLASLYGEFVVIQKDAGEKAIENYQKAIELDPKNLDIYQAMANVQITLADLEVVKQNSSKKQGEGAEIPQKSLEYLAMAEEYLKKALEIKADHLGANVLLVSVYEKQKNIDGAIQKAKDNLEIYPNSAEVRLDLGRIYYQQKNFDEAEKHLKVALEMDGQYSNARYLLGLILNERKNTGGALEEFRKIKASNPDNELISKIIDNLENGRRIFYGTSRELPLKEAEKAEESLSEETELTEETSGENKELTVENSKEVENNETIENGIEGVGGDGVEESVVFE